MITRRSILRGLGAVLLSGVSTASYALGIEPFRLVTTRYQPKLPGWPNDLRLKLAVVADIHACRPWMTPEHIRSIVEQTNALKPDVTLLLGDYVVAHKWITERVPATEWAAEFAKLSAPLGVHAVLGNHDWWDDPIAQARGHGPTVSGKALEAAGIPVYENDVVRLSKDGHPFWLAGLGDQLALRRKLGSKVDAGVSRLVDMLAKITDAAPVIMMAHEPDVFVRTPPRVALTISGHTHGGQIRAFGRPVLSPYRHDEPYSYGHFIERTSDRFPNAERHLIVSGGLGCSLYPIRLGVPPEIVVIELGDHGTP